MARGVSFAEVLDEKVAGHRKAEPAPAPHVPFTPTIGFYFDTGTVAPEVRARATARARAAAPPPRAAAGPRPPRTLTASERQALETLVGLGAAIDADFTAETLRSAFRLLARRHHPDRHPRSSDLERARQSAVFAQLHDAYRRLQPVASAS